MRATTLTLGEATVDIGDRALVMGILNRTPDSFYDKGATFALDDLVRRAERLVDDGADLLDVGGVKAGPGPAVSEDEELDRVIPAIEALHARFDLPLSVDTWRASVAKEAYAAGAVVGNDISGFADPEYLAVAAAAGATVVATHIRLGPRIPDPEPVYDDVVERCGRLPGGTGPLGPGGRAHRRPDRPRRRPRPGQDGGTVAHLAPRLRPAGRSGPPPPPLGLQQDLPRRGARPRHRPSDARPRWPPPPWAPPWGAGSCGSTTSPPTARCAR